MISLAIEEDFLTMSFSVLLSFAAASLLLAIAPGPDNIFVLTQSALYGAKKGMAVIAGLCLGIMCQTFCLIVGVSALIAAYPALMIAIKLIGVAYLSYLSYQALKAAWQLKTVSTSHSTEPQLAKKSAPQMRMGQLIRRGFIMNITNPKVQLFFLSFFPQFLPSNAHGLTLAWYMLVLGAIFALDTILVFGAIALGAGTLSQALHSPAFNCKLNLGAALVFIGLSLYTLLSL